MTLAGGALFGLVESTLIVSLASTIGATLAMLASRFVARDWVRARFPKAVGAVDRGVERDGNFYLLTLRSEEHTSELQSLMRISFAVFCLKKQHRQYHIPPTTTR